MQKLGIIRLSSKFTAGDKQAAYNPRPEDLQGQLLKACRAFLLFFLVILLSIQLLQEARRDSITCIINREVDPRIYLIQSDEFGRHILTVFFFFLKAKVTLF